MPQTDFDIIWPGWEVVGKLGEGSFGGVYEIQRTLPDGTVERAALKKLTVPKDPGEIEVLYAQSYNSASITEHFKEQMQSLVREYTFMQKLSANPYVVHCQDLRTVQRENGIGWDIYIQMELLTPLKKWMNNRGSRYDERIVIRLGLNLCGALNSCHQQNIIHRDIKPENILLTSDNKFKLGDFGIAKVSEKTATGTLTGTYSYMAPEVANRQHYGASADIYSLGLVMYWMMNERTLPFLPLSKKIPSGLQRQEAQDRRFSGEEIPAPLNGSLELTRIVLKACAFDPKERYSSVQELARDLKQYAHSIQGSRRDVIHPESLILRSGIDESADTTIGTAGSDNSLRYPKQKPRKNTKKAKLIAVAVLVIAVSAGLVLGTVSRHWAKQNELLQETEKTLEGTPVVTEMQLETELAPESTISETHPIDETVASSEENTIPQTTESHSPYAAKSGNVLCSDMVEFNYLHTEYAVFGTDIQRTEIKTITFLNTIDGAPSDAWDLSERRDGSVLGWVTGGPGNYDLFIAGNGGVSVPRNCRNLFAGYSNLEYLDFRNCFDTSNVSDMRNMFGNCCNMTNLDLSTFDTSRVTEMAAMFADCSSLDNLDLSSFDTTNVTSMNNMFYKCSRLANLNLSSFDTSLVNDTSGMFWKCSSLVSLDLSGFNTSNVRCMSQMFYGCDSLTDLDLGRFDTSKIETAEDHYLFMEYGKTYNGRPWGELFQ